MSWDVIIFSSTQKINTVEEIDEEMFEPIDFCSILAEHFSNIKQQEDHREISGDGFSISYYTDEEPVSNKMFSLYGERGLFELIRISKIHGWQIFDTGNGEMINLEEPEKNGYKDFQDYLAHVLKNSSGDNSN